MTPSEKLECMIQDAGFFRVETWYQHGAYRHMDGARWGAYAENEEGHTMTLFSWDTMTQCVRKGINITPTGDAYGEYEISAKSKYTKESSANDG